MWASSRRSAVTRTHFVLLWLQHKRHSQMHRSVSSEQEGLHFQPACCKDQEITRNAWVVVMTGRGAFMHRLNILAITKNIPRPCCPSCRTNTWPWHRGPSFTWGYPVAGYEKSQWILDTNSRAGLRGDFQCRQTTVGLARHFALSLSQSEQAFAAQQVYLAVGRLTDLWIS